MRPCVFAIMALAAAVAVVPVSGGAGARAGGRPHTIATTSSPILRLHADGRRLVWETGEALGTFDVVSHHRATVRTTVPRRRVCYEADTIGAEAFARNRFIFECDGAGLSDEHADIVTWALDDRRVRGLASFEIGYDETDPGDFGNRYDYPARIGGGAGTLVFFGIDSEDRPDGLFRVAGGRAVHLPYESVSLAAVAAAGRFVATLDWVSRCSCDRTPVYSPDGTEIAWSHDGALWLMRSDGTQQHLVSAAGTDPRWSPSGSTLAFDGRDGIHLVDHDGGNEHRLAAGGLPDWSPDGTKVAFVRGDNAGGTELWTVNADGSGEQRLAGDVRFGRPDWSPDGTSIVVDVFRPPAYQGRIYVIDAATGLERDLAGGSSPIWSPDGSKIAFIDWYSSLDVMDADGSGVHTVYQSVDGLGAEHPAWSPDGRRVAFATFGQDYNAYQGVVGVVDADGSNPGILLSRYVPGAPAWSPNGRTIVTGDGEAGDGAGDKQGIWALDVVGAAEAHLLSEKLTTAIEVRNSRSGKLLQRWEVPTESQFVHDGGWVSVSSRYVVASFWHPELGNVIARFDIGTGQVLGTAPWPSGAGAVSLAGRWGIYTLGRRTRLIDVKTGRTWPLPARGAVAGPVFAGNRVRVFWAEPFRKGSRVRELLLGG